MHSTISSKRGVSNAAHGTEALGLVTTKDGLSKFLDMLTEQTSSRMEERIAFAKRCEAARTDFAVFQELVARDERGKPLADTPLSRFFDSYFQYLFDRHRECDGDPARTLHGNLVTPPGGGKTTKAIYDSVFEIGKRPTIRVVAISGEKTVSDSMVALARDIITRVPDADVIDATGDRTPVFQRIFPEAKPDLRESMAGEGATRGWRQDKFYLITEGQGLDPTMQSVALIPKGESRRVDLLIADDIISERIATSPTERANAIRSFHATWLDGRLKSMGRTGLCLHMQNIRNRHDLAHQLVTDTRFLTCWIGVYPDMSGCFIRLNNCPDDFPIVQNPGPFEAEEVEPSILPTDKAERWTREYAVPLSFLGMTEESLSRIESNTRRRLYFLQAADPEDMAFPSFPERKVIDATVAELLGVEESAGIPVFDQPANMRTVTMGGLDWSSKKRRGVRLHFWTKTHEGLLVPSFHRVIGKIDELITTLNTLWSHGWRWSYLYSEDNATQDRIAEAIQLLDTNKNARNSWASTIKAFSTGSNKHGEFGVKTMDSGFENHTIIWPGKEADRSRDWRVLEEEFSSCTNDDMFGGTPDSIMAAWFPYRAISTMTVAAKSNKPEAVSGDSLNRMYYGY